jgi:putative CocE/NonD family hydrolase
MAGWYDPFLPTQLRDFETIRREAAPHVAKNSRLIIGPWTHAGEARFPDGRTGPEYRPASVGPSLPWFDHHLLGRPLEGALEAPVLIYVLGENKWRAEHEWPLARARDMPLYLAGSPTGRPPSKGGRLTVERPADREPVRTFIYDPRNPVPSRGGAMLGYRAGIYLQNDVETRADVLVFTSEPLAEALEITGPVRAVLYVTTSAPNTDFTVKLVDVHPDGKAYNVTDGILRRAYQQSRANAPTEITVELSPTSMLFRKGHRIRIHISSSNYPRFDRNPNTGRDIARETSPVSAVQQVFLGGDTASRIVLSVVPR